MLLYVKFELAVLAASGLESETVELEVVEHIENDCLAEMDSSEPGHLEKEEKNDSHDSAENLEEIEKDIGLKLE